MKKIFLALVAMVATCTLSAQDLRWGVTGGLNFANQHLAKGNSSDCYIGFNLGVKAEMDLSYYIEEGFYADARALYTLKGGQWKGFHNNLGYIELPLNFGYRYALNQDVSLFAGLGPYFAVGVLGKNVAEAGDVKVKTDLFGQSYKRFDWGLNYNIGVELKGDWQCFLGFEHSLMNAAKSSPEGDEVKVRPLNFYIGAAYMF